MLTSTTKARLVAFAAISSLSVGYAGATYAGLGDWAFDDGYSVSLELAESGGLYEGAEVTYRGVTVGQVRDLRPTAEGVVAELDLEGDLSIPADTRAEVHNRSAIGEQYVDLLPDGPEGPFLGAGDVIAQDRTSTPLQEEELVLNLNRFVTSVGREDLRTVVDEAGTAFDDIGHPLGQLNDNTQLFVRKANRNLGPTVGLLEDSPGVLRTQGQTSGALRSFAKDLASLSGDLRRADPDLRTVIRDGNGAARQVRLLVEQLEPRLKVLLPYLQAVTGIAAIRLDNIEQFLVGYPVSVAAGFSVSPGDGLAHFALVTTEGFEVCRKGYLPPDKWRLPSQTRRVPVFMDARCEEPPPTNVRGSQHAPPPGSR